MMRSNGDLKNENLEFKPKDTGFHRTSFPQKVRYGEKRDLSQRDKAGDF